MAATIEALLDPSMIFPYTIFLTFYYAMNIYLIYCLVKGYFCRGGINRELKDKVLNKRISFILMIMIFEGPQFARVVLGYWIHFSEEGWLEY